MVLPIELSEMTIDWTGPDWIGWDWMWLGLVEFDRVWLGSIGSGSKKYMVRRIGANERLTARRIG